ncbi:hypothetical protein PM082_023205 [Marasmius tenuissimus]|nr:hypothetical protein PM082_023205 [Marasmius tenuissimus]
MHPTHPGAALNFEDCPGCSLKKMAQLGDQCLIIFILPMTHELQQTSGHAQLIWLRVLSNLFKFLPLPKIQGLRHSVSLNLQL